MWQNLKPASLEFSCWNLFLAWTQSAVIDNNLYKLYWVVWLPAVCVWGQSVKSIKEWLLNLQFMAFTILYLFLLCLCSVCLSFTQIPCQLVSLSTKIITLELLWLLIVNMCWVFLSSSSSFLSFFFLFSYEYSHEKSCM